MKKNWLILLALWVLSLVGISFYGGPIVYGFFYLITLIPIVSLLYLWCVYFRFKIYQEVEGRTLVGNKKTRFKFSLQNEDFFAFAGVRVRFYTDFSEITGIDDGVEYELLPHTGIQKETEIVCKYRGEYEVGIEKVTITDFFRLFSVTYRNDPALEVIVKPQIVSLTGLRSVDIDQISPRDTDNGQMQDILVREYMPGDEMRRIHWRASAKGGPLMVRKQIGEEKKEISIVMFPERVGDDRRMYLKRENKQLETLIALVLFLAGKGIPTGVYSMQEQLWNHMVDHIDRFDSFYAAASDFQFLPEHSADGFYEKLLAQGRILGSKGVFMILSSWDSASQEFAFRLNENNVDVTAYVIADPSEIREEHMEPYPRTNVYFVASDAELEHIL